MTNAAVAVATPAGAASRVARNRDARVVVGAFAGVLLVVVVWGHWVAHHAARSVVLGAIPFFGRWQLVLSGGLVLAAGVAAALILVLTYTATSGSWRRLLATVAIGTVVFGAALAYAGPPRERWEAIHTDYGQHIGLVDASGGPGAFVRDYVADQSVLPTHLSAHPPGMTLLLWTASRAALEGPGFESALSLLGAAAAAVAALVALGSVAGTSVARRAAPFVVVAPAAIWHTNADTFFAGVAVAAVALVVVASHRKRRDAVGLAAVGGVVFGLALLLTYGVALLALPMIAVTVWRRAWTALAAAAVGTTATLVVPLLWGFSWLDGLAATKHQYDHNLADVRPYGYFLVANLAVFATAIGPAVLVGLARLRDRRSWVLVGAALATVAVADLSGLSSAETERIWQPFMPLVLVAGAAVAADAGRWSARRWLTVQAAGTIALQAVLRSPW